MNLEHKLLSNLTVFEILTGVVLTAFLVLLVAELLLRWNRKQKASQPALGEGKFLRFHPFVMATGPKREHSLTWVDEFNAGIIQMPVKTNDLGFISPTQYSITGSQLKAKKDKIVVWTGGSAAWGIGASHMEKTTARRLEFYLNQHQSDYNYRVENMAMGSWVAFQEFNALALWGDYFNPDWVLSLDGYNDASVTCAHAQGAGKPMYYELMSGYIRSYLEEQRNPTFYRGRFENSLLQYSRLYQKLSGKKFIPCPWEIDRSDPAWGQFAIGKTNWGELKDATEFFMSTHQKMTRLFPDAGYIFGLQPLPDNHKRITSGLYESGMVDDEKSIEHARLTLEELYTKYNEEPAGATNWEKGKQYFFTKIAIEESAWARAVDNSERPVVFSDLSRLFPIAFEDSKRCFMDSCHLTDVGQDIVAKHYADLILHRDLGKAPAPLEDALKREFQSVMTQQAEKSEHDFKIEDWAKVAQEIRRPNTNSSLKLSTELMRRVLFLEHEIRLASKSGMSSGMSAELIQKVMG